MHAIPLTDLELAVGMPLGASGDVAVLPEDDTLSPREAVEAVVRDALVRPPCLVSFSGGRDSSAMLATAVRVARREGLALPIPITLVFPEDELSTEDDWQSQVLDHLNLPERETVRVVGDQFDVVGPLAQEILLRHGLLWPYNAHWHAPIARAASGGSVVTGFGGDELALSSQEMLAERVLAAGRPQTVHDMRAVLSKRGPRSLRLARRLLDRLDVLQLSPWLTRRGRTAVRLKLAAYGSRFPFGWSGVLRDTHWRSRYLQIGRHTLQALGSHYDTAFVSPLVDPRVLTALATRYPVTGVGDRTELMRTLFGDLLPDGVLARESKAVFNDSLWTPTSRHFASTWSGTGIDPRLVDAERLRSAWTDRETSAFSSTLMQQAWLSGAGRAA